MRRNLPVLTETQQQISDLLYEELNYMYCDNCRFSELSEKESLETFGYWGCEDCHRKYNGWGISQAECNRLARIIGGMNKE